MKSIQFFVGQLGFTFCLFRTVKAPYSLDLLKLSHLFIIFCDIFVLLLRPYYSSVIAGWRWGQRLWYYSFTTKAASMGDIATSSTFVSAAIRVVTQWLSFFLQHITSFFELISLYGVLFSASIVSPLSSPLDDKPSRVSSLPSHKFRAILRGISSLLLFLLLLFFIL